jgi:hypothetical protein
MKFNQQQRVADVLTQYQDAFIIGVLNAYELAGKLLAAAREAEVDAMAEDVSDHVCMNDEWGSGQCAHPSHSYELVEPKVESQSEAYRLAHS